MLTVENIKKRQFPKKFVGYDSEEVDRFKKDVLSYIASLKEDLKTVQEEVNTKEDELKKSEEGKKGLIVKTQEIESTISHQDKVNSNLKEKNRRLLEEINECKKREDSIKEVMFLAKKTSDEIINNAHKKASDILENAQKQEREILNKLIAIENRIPTLKKDFLDILNSHSKALESEIGRIEQAITGFKNIQENNTKDIN